MEKITNKQDVKNAFHIIISKANKNFKLKNQDILTGIIHLLFSYERSSESTELIN